MPISVVGKRHGLPSGERDPAADQPVQHPDAEHDREHPGERYADQGEHEEQRDNRTPSTAYQNVRSCQPKCESR